MPNFQRLLDLNKMIEQTTVPPILINDIPNDTEKDLNKFFNQVTTQYFGDKVSMLPHCNCGFLRSRGASGVTCPVCLTVVTSSIENDIQSVLWFRRPESIHSLMSPIVFTMLRERFSKQGWDVIQWFTDTTYKPIVKMTTFMVKIMDENIPRGWNNFCMNFDKILTFLFSIRDFWVKKGEIDYLFYLWKTHRDKFFTNYLPLPNKSMFVYENTNVGIYRNTPTDKAIQFISLMVSVEHSIRPLSDKAKENRIGKLYIKMSDYQKDHIRNELSPKAGQIRRHLVATKTIMSCRSVITSITSPHDHEGIEIPWGIGLTTLRPQLMNKILAHGFSLNKAIDFVMTNIGCWNPLLDRFLNELREEAVDGKMWSLIQRNPSLKQGASQLVYFSKFKRDPGDKTIGMPIGIVKAPNA